MMGPSSLRFIFLPFIFLSSREVGPQGLRATDLLIRGAVM
jgi:hypothetical protein